VRGDRTGRSKGLHTWLHEPRVKRRGAGRS
jgi:hypothetical protein